MKHSPFWLSTPRLQMAFALLVGPAFAYPYFSNEQWLNASAFSSPEQSALMMAASVSLVHIVVAFFLERHLRQRPDAWEFWASLPLSVPNQLRARLTSATLIAVGAPIGSAIGCAVFADWRGVPMNRAILFLLAVAGVGMLRSAALFVRQPRTQGEEVVFHAVSALLLWGSVALSFGFNAFGSKHEYSKIAAWGIFVSAVAILGVTYWKAEALSKWPRGEQATGRSVPELPAVGSSLGRTVRAAASGGQLFAILGAFWAWAFAGTHMDQSILFVGLLAFAIGVGHGLRSACRALAGLPVSRARVFAHVCPLPAAALLLSLVIGTATQRRESWRSPRLLEFSISGVDNVRYKIVPHAVLWRVSLGQPPTIELPNSQRVVPRGVPLWPGAPFQRYNPYETGADPDGSAFRFQLTRAINDNFQGHWSEADVAAKVLVHKEWLWSIEDKALIPELIHRERVSWARVVVIGLTYASGILIMLWLARLWREAGRNKWLYLGFPTISVASGFVGGWLFAYVDVASADWGQLTDSSWCDLTPGSMGGTFFLLDVFANQHLHLVLPAATALLALICRSSLRAAERFPIALG